MIGKATANKQTVEFNRPPLPEGKDDILRYLRDLENEQERFVEAVNRELNKKKDA